ncbi:MAG: 2-amino-3,7-dideoxy-D-threo-hept-6-ulosonate synthase [Thaumarchaeota archaeon]|nr:2-amino-3,7-dideoxy-D-threo-hept-6-ulosonate synthase [Nitrososphaerota archaeon]
MVFGKVIRLNRITKRGKMLCIPMDHGFTIGPTKGLDNINDTILKIQSGGASAVLVHKGIIRNLPFPTEMGTIMHMSGSTNQSVAPNRKMKVAGVPEAVRLGADAVSVHINVGSKEEPEMLRDLGVTADECDEWQMPLIAMMYPRGEKIKNPNDPEIVAHVARLGAELGADIIKTVYTGDVESFRKVVKGCPVPIIIAGGPKAENDKELLIMTKEAMDAGAFGVAFGRSVFQHDNPSDMVRALGQIIYEDANVADALKVIPVGKQKR